MKPKVIDFQEKRTLIKDLLRFLNYSWFWNMTSQQTNDIEEQQ